MLESIASIWVPLIDHSADEEVLVSRTTIRLKKRTVSSCTPWRQTRRDSCCSYKGKGWSHFVALLGNCIRYRKAFRRMISFSSHCVYVLLHSSSSQIKWTSWGYSVQLKIISDNGKRRCRPMSLESIENQHLNSNTQWKTRQTLAYERLCRESTMICRQGYE